MSRVMASPQEILRNGLEIECAECKKPFRPKSIKEIEEGICPGCLSLIKNKGGKEPENKTVNVKELCVKKNRQSTIREKTQLISHRADPPYSNHHRGYRTIDKKKIYFPNRMEANYYRYLLWQKKHQFLQHIF